MDSMNTLFDNRYQLIEMLGKGSYGSAYSAIDIYNHRTVALKIAHYSLSREAQVYELLRRNDYPTGIPRMLHYVNSGPEYIVMEKLGKSLQHYWNYCGCRFSLKTTVMLGIQIISRLEGLHSRGIVHGDIKQDNFVMDEQCRMLHIIDFGRSCVYIDPTTGAHVPEEPDESVIGTISYASINMHNNIRMSRRDDLEAAAYMLLRLFKVTLPWHNQFLVGLTFEKRFEEVGQIKKNTDVDFLCEGLPEQFKQLIVTVRGLGFAERPDYANLQGLLRCALGQRGNIDWIYDWMV